MTSVEHCLLVGLSVVAIAAGVAAISGDVRAALADNAQALSVAADSGWGR